MRITASLPDHGAVIEAVLEGFTKAAQLVIESGVVPPSPRDAGIRYREERGTEEWLLPNQVMERGVGDCEDLCIWTAGGLRATGEDPEARCALRQTGPTTIHCVVELGDGSTMDPSLERLMTERGTPELFSVGGWTLGDTVVIKDHRTADHRPKPGQKQGDAASQYMADHGLTNLVIDDGRGRGRQDPMLTDPTMNDRNTAYINPLFVQTSTDPAAKQLLNAVRDAVQVVGPQHDAFTRGTENAAAVGERVRYAGSGSGTPVGATGQRKTTTNNPYAFTDRSGNMFWRDPKTGYIYDPSTDTYYDPNTIDPYTGQPQVLLVDPTTGQLVPQQYDQYGNPIGQYDQYGGYGYYNPYDPYGMQYQGQYGYPTAYGYDPFWRGDFPDASESAYDMPVTYEDIYGGEDDPSQLIEEYELVDPELTDDAEAA